MMKMYEDDLELRHLLRAFMGLALLPTDLIYEGFEILKEKVQCSSKKDQLEIFVSYFQKQWIQQCKPSMWCVNKSTWRTNNFAEGRII